MSEIKNRASSEELTDDGHSRRQVMRMAGFAAAAAAVGSLLPMPGSDAVASESAKPLEVLFAIYPEGTLLDFAGPNELLSRIPNTRVRFASPSGGMVKLEMGVQFGPTEKLADVGAVDVICVPGGPDLSAMMTAEMLAHVRRISRIAKERYVTSVCTGSIILAASGVLTGKARRESHWASLNVLQISAIRTPVVS